MKSKKLWCYLAITFILTWGCWILMALNSNSIFVMLNSQLIIAATMWVPMIGAILTKLIFRKKEQITLMLKPRFKGNIKLYLAAWFAPTILMLLGTVVYFLMFPKYFDSSFLGIKSINEMYAQLMRIGSSEGAKIIVGWLVFGMTAVLAPLINTIFAVGEEIGWRGFMFPTISEKLSPTKAIIVSGIIWGVWHAPITAMGHNYGMNYWGYPITGILTMCVFCTFLGAFLSWLTYKTKSVWPAALAHGAVNAVAGYSIYVHNDIAAANPLLGPTMVGLVGGIPIIALGVLCIISLKKENNHKINKKTELTEI